MNVVIHHLFNMDDCYLHIHLASGTRLSIMVDDHIKIPYPSRGISSNPLTTWQLKWISMCTFSYMCEWSYKLSHNVIWVPPPNKRSHFSFLLSIESCVKFSKKLYLYDTWIYLTLIKSVLLVEFCTYMILMYDGFVPYNEQ